VSLQLVGLIASLIIESATNVKLKWRKGECVHDSINILDEEYKDVTDVDGGSSLNVTCL